MARNVVGVVVIDQAESNRKSLGLPWIFCDLLCIIKKQKSIVLGPTLQELGESQVRPTSFLHKLSLDMAAKEIGITAEEWMKTQTESKEHSQSLSLWNSRFSSSSEADVQLICFGPAISSCTGYPSSLDVFVYHFGQSLKQLIDIAEELVE